MIAVYGHSIAIYFYLRVIETYKKSLLHMFITLRYVHSAQKFLDTSKSPIFPGMFHNKAN